MVKKMLLLVLNNVILSISPKVRVMKETSLSILAMTHRLHDRDSTIGGSDLSIKMQV